VVADSEVWSMVIPALFRLDVVFGVWWPLDGTT
jgi:hypothetical protein